ncbi:MAG TPA: ATP-binding protein [Herpetosiphonaceae bacterium]
MSQQLASILHNATANIAAMLDGLRAETERLRQRHAALAADERQTRRALDELAVQRSFAEQINSPALARMRQQEAEQRGRIGALEQETAQAAEAVKRLEQFVRQLEMSSTSLHGAPQTNASDPWALALRGQIIHGREEERVRLAREVHDGPAQVLANVLMGLEHAINLQASQHPKLPEFLGELRAAARQGLHDVRGFIADLRPGALANGFPAAVAEYVQQYARTTNIQVILDLHEWPPSVSSEIEIVLYRVVQESLQNINKHAKHAEVRIRSVYRGDELFLVIKDNGPGFDPREVARRTGKESWGLTSMRERVGLVGGQFSIASRPGAGTEVTLRIPV